MATSASSDAQLHVLFVSGGTDASVLEPGAELAALLSQQGPRRVVTVSALLVDGAGCTEPTAGIAQLIDRTGGQVIGGCALSSAAIAQVGRMVLEVDPAFVLRGEAEDVNGDGFYTDDSFEGGPHEIEVLVDGVPLPGRDDNGSRTWSYDVDSRLVRVESSAELDPDSTVEISYTNVCH